MSLAYGEQQRNSSALSASGAGGQRELERQYHVVLQDSLGHPALGFREGTWFRLTVSGPQPLQLRGAIRTCPHAAGSIVQIACWWMRENPMQPRSLDLATELALTVGELVRVCPADGLGTTSMDLLPMAMAAVAQSGPPVAPAPALPGGFGSTSDAFGTGPAFGSGTSSSAASSGYSSASSGGYGQTSGSGSSSGAYSTTSSYGSSSTDSYGSSSGSTDAYGGSSSGYSNGSGYGSSGYGSTNSSGGYSTSSSVNAYAALADPLTDPLPSQSSYTSSSDSLGQSGYGSGTYATTSSYDSAQTSYLPAVTSAGTSASATSNGWFEPADGTGTGGFPAVPPPPVIGRPAKPAPAAASAPAVPSTQSVPKNPYAGAPGAGSGRGYQGGATQQAALPPANRPRESSADWEPRAAAPRRPVPGGGSSHQPRPQQSAAPRPAPGGAVQQPRPRPQPPRDGYGRPAEPQPDLGRSSDRNGVPPRRPAVVQQQRGTMGQRPATRPGRPSGR